MTQNKHHHFVPQFYLRRFGSGGVVSLFNLDRRKHVPKASIAGQCQRPYLYGKEPSLEKLLGAMEDAAATVISNILDELRLPAIPSAEDASLLRFVAYQWGRTPAAGEVANSMATKVAHALFKVPGVLPDDLKEYAEEVQLQHAEPAVFSLGLTASIVPILLDLHKCILVNEAKIEFITSDAPVIMHNAWCEGVTWQGTTGFAAGGLQILLPLDPRRALLLFDRDVYAVGCKQAPQVVRIKEAYDVEAVNKMQMTTVQSNFYYSGDFATAESIDRLSAVWRKPASDSVIVRRAVDDENKSHLLHVYRSSEARLPLSFLRIVKKASRIPLRERPRRYREAAIAMDAVLKGPRRERYKQPNGRGWKTVRDDV